MMLVFCIVEILDGDYCLAQYSKVKGQMMMVMELKICIKPINKFALKFDKHCLTGTG